MNSKPIDEQLVDSGSTSSTSSDDTSTTSSSSQLSTTSSSSNQSTAHNNTRTDPSMKPNNNTSKGKPKDIQVHTSVSSVKRYQNSPFGLTRHYLTMPDDEPNNSAKMLSQEYTTKGSYNGLQSSNRHRSRKNRNSDTTDTEDSETSPTKEHVKNPKETRTFAWTENQTNSKTSPSDHFCPDLSTTNCDLSMMGPSSIASISPPVWPDGYNHELSHKLSKKSSSRHLSSPSGLLSPAGDAGLDATKCNAKLADPNCFFDADGNIIDANKKKKLDNLTRTHESNGLLVRFSSIMYATFLVILGCILHVSELRQKSKNSTDHIYTTIVALIGIIWLLFLQTDLQRYKRYATKFILIETIFRDHHQKNLDIRRSELSQTGDPFSRSVTSSSASLVNDRMSMNTEVIFKKTAYKMNQHQAALNVKSSHQAGKNHNNLYRSRHPKRKSSFNTQALDLYRDRDAFSDVLSNESLSSNHENLIPAYKFLHGKMGANFYLKCGMAAFCFGHVIHEGLRFGQQLYFFGNGNIHCRDSAALIAHLITPLYSFYQLFMMFKYSNLVINRHKILARFGLMHIIGTSVTFWFRTILEEAFEDFVHKMDYFKANKPQMSFDSFNSTNLSYSNIVSLFNLISTAIKDEAIERSDKLLGGPNNQSSINNVTMAQSLLTLMSSPISATITPQLVRNLPDSYACAQNTLLTTKSMNALPYLYPFTIEYNLLLAATFLSLYFNIGKIGNSGEDSTISCRTDPISSPQSYANILAKPRSFNNSPSSHVGSSVMDSSAIRMREHLEHEKELGEYKSNFVVNADCHSANKGLFCGFFVLLVTLVTIVIFFVTINKPSHVQFGIKINLIQETTLTAVILIVTLFGFKQIVKLNRNPYLKDKVTTDDVLMLIPLPFFFIHSLLSFRAETASMSASSITSIPSFLTQVNHHNSNQSAPTSRGNVPSSLLSTNSDNNNNTRFRLKNLLASHSNGTNGRFVEDFINSDSSESNRSNSNGRKGRIISNNVGSGIDSSQIDHFKLITVALNIIVMIEVLVQTNFIIDGMRRCSESRYLRFKKPGRELITFAILLNITYWIVATFETKSVEQYKTEIEYYGPLPYMFISHTTLPVMLFYRYHSSVCLAEIWNRAYKPPKKR